MGASQSDTSEPHLSKDDDNSLTPPNFEILSQTSGLDDDTIQYSYTQVFQRQRLISREEFMKYLSLKTPSLVKFNTLLLTIFFNFSSLEEPDPSVSCTKDGNLSFQGFICTVSVLLGKHPTVKPTQRSHLILESLSKNSETCDSLADSKFPCSLFYNLMESLYELFSNNLKNTYTFCKQEAEFLKAAPYPSEVLSFLFKDSEYLSSNQIQTFLDTQFPRWVELIESFITYSFIEPKEEDVTSRANYHNATFAPLIKEPPNFLCMKDVFHVVMSIGPSLKKGRSAEDIPVWDRLYDSSEHGFSLNRFETHVFKYPGPTLVFIRGAIDSTNSELKDREIILAGYLDEVWKKSKYPWGGKNTRVFEVSPNFERFISSGQRQEHVIFNNQIGIGFGPSTPAKTSAPGTFLVNIHPSLQTASYAGWLTFLECPAFKPSNYRTVPFDSFSAGVELSLSIDDIIVFGLGGEPARKRQNAEWAFEEADIDRRANISSFKNPHDPANRQILEMAGVLSEDNPSVYRATHQEF